MVFNLGWIIALGVVAFALYYPMLDFGFLGWDDRQYIRDNPYIHQLDLTSIARLITLLHASNWHPLTWLSHAIDWSLWGNQVWGHRLISILLHSINAVLTAALAWNLAERARVMQGAVAGILAGLLFVVHPQHVEAVAWLSERKELLCTMFYLAALLAYLQQQYTAASAEPNHNHNQNKKMARSGAITISTGNTVKAHGCELAAGVVAA